MITAKYLKNKANVEAPDEIVKMLLPLLESVALQGKGHLAWSYPHALTEECRGKVFKKLEELGFRLKFEVHEDYPEELDLASMIISWE